MPKSINRKLAEVLVPSTTALKESVLDDISAGVTPYATLDDLPTSNLTLGDQAFVTSNQRLYLSNGSGWYNVAMFNATPNLTISPSGVITLATDGSTPTIITLTGTDSDNADANLVYTAESDGSFGGLATLSQDSSVFTITPLAEGSATITSSTLTFKVSDGINFGSGTTEFSLTFGPDWTATPTETKLFADEPGASEQLGYVKRLAISEDGNYLAAGVELDDGAADAGPNNQGAVNIYVRSGSSWSLQQVVRTGIAASAFGSSVSLDETGTYLLAGAKSETWNGTNQTGNAHIYKRTGSTWTYMQALNPSDNNTNGDNFGFSCSISKDGTVAAVTAYAHDGPGDAVSNSGSVYRFSRSGETWSEDEIVQSASPAVNQYFGTSVAISEDGTYMIVGAQGTNSFNGSVTFFTWNGSSWNLDQTINGPSGTGRLGFDVDISNDGIYAISGAYLNTPDQAYIWTRSGSTWTQQALLTASDANSTDNFGGSVNISGDGNYCIVGAQYEDGGAGDPLSQSGAAYVFERSGTSWSEVRKITASDAEADHWFGNPVRMNYNGKYVAISASLDDGPSDAVTNTGAVYVYEA